MRGMMGTLIIFLVCLVIVVLYLFLGRGQITTTQANYEAQIAAKDLELAAIHQKINQIPALKALLPTWREQLQIFNAAIPLSVDDHVFVANLVDQLEQYPDVKLMSIDSVFGGPWLGKVEEPQEEVLVSYGIDVESAKSIRVSFFTLKLLGDFDEVLTIIENLKKYRRLYTIDMISGPVTGGSGAVAKSADPEVTPIQITGRLYFNLPEPMVDINEMTRMYLEVFADMLQNDMVDAGKLAVTGHTPVEAPAPGSSPTDENNSEDAEDERTSGKLDDGSTAEESQQADDNLVDIALAGVSGSPVSGV